MAVSYETEQVEKALAALRKCLRAKIEHGQQLLSAAQSGGATFQQWERRDRELQTQAEHISHAIIATVTHEQYALFEQEATEANDRQPS